MKKSNNSLFLFFMMSVFLHLAIFVYIQIDTYLHTTQVHLKPIEIVIVEHKSNPRVQVEQKKVVEQDEKPINDKIDNKTKYLSQNNQKIAKETQAALAGKFSNAAGKGLAKSEKAKKISKDESTVHTESSGQEKFKITEQAHKVKDPSPTEDNTDGDGKDVSRNNAYLKDVKKGEETILSTKTFMYYAYFKKIRDRIEQYWEPAIKPKFQKILESERGIASIDHTTKLLIILDSEGELIGVKKLNTSGIQDLDETAMEAFKIATPFPPPPPGLVDKNGLVKIRWDFVLEEQ